MTIAVTALFCSYIIFVILVIAGWRKAIKQTTEIQPERYISVIVPVRNESRNIENVLQDLINQTYKNFEVIIVDDHSQDDTSAKVIGNADTRIKLVENSGTGKKSAIDTGIQLAKGEIIVTTDGDCRLPSNWLTAVNGCFTNRNVAMVTGLVALHPAITLFERMQQVEFASLMASSTAMLAAHFPTMCNGANLAYRREVYFKVGGFSGNEHIPSGDDEFLMRKIAVVPGNTMRVNHSGVVLTNPQPDIRTFFQQRIRWASKWKYNDSWGTRLLAAYIVIFQVTVIYSCFLIAGGYTYVIAPLALKVLVEFVLFLIVSRHLNFKVGVLPFVLLQISYPFYVAIVGIAALFSGYSWKGRSYQS